MRLSIIVPVFNERATVLEVPDRLAALAVDKEIFVVDDGSTDGTHELLADRVREVDGAITLVRHPANRGKGAALTTGVGIHEVPRGRSQLAPLGPTSFVSGTVCA